MSKQSDLLNLTDAISVSGTNVGIGTSSPTFTAAYGGLHIHSTYPELHMTGTDSGSGAGDGFKIQKNSANHVYLWNYENANMVLGTNNTERMRLHASGGLSFANTTDVGPYNAVLGYRNNHFTGQRSNTVAAGDTSTVFTLVFGLNGAAIVRVVDTGTVNTSDYFANVYEYFVTCYNNTVTATLKQSQAGGGYGSLITTSTSAATFNVIQTGDASLTTWHDTAIDVLVAAAGNAAHATATITMAANN